MTEKRKWVQAVKTVSTFPPAELFTKDAQTIATAMASKKVSPRGIGSGIRMIQYFINRAGKHLAADRKEELEKAKHILQTKLKSARSRPAKASSGKATTNRRRRAPKREHHGTSI